MTIPSGKWVIDPSHSSVDFTVRHLMISKVKGSFGTFTGTATTDGDVTESTLEATIDVTSINTNDSGRDNHLRSAEFFDVENYPTMTFISTSVESTKHDDVFLIHGNLTIKGVTKSATFHAEIGGVTVDPYGQTKAAAEATTKINRSDFGLSWNAALETGGVLVSEEVSISLDIQATLQK